MALALRMKPVFRARGFFANVRGFKITLQASEAEVRPGESVTFTAEFSYRERPVPDANVRLYVNEAMVSELRTGRDGRLSTSRIFERGNYNVIARHESPLLVVESNPIAVKAGYTLNVEQPSAGTVTPTPGTYPYQVEDVWVTASDPSFDHWEINGEDAGSANPILAVMDRDVTISARLRLRAITVRLTWTGFQPPIAQPNTRYPVVWNAYLTPPGATEPWGQVNVYNFNPNTGQAGGTQQLDGPAGSWHAVIVFWADAVHGSVFVDKMINLPASATLSYDFYTGLWTIR